MVSTDYMCYHYLEGLRGRKENIMPYKVVAEGKRKTKNLNVGDVAPEARYSAKTKKEADSIKKWALKYYRSVKIIKL